MAGLPTADITLRAPRSREAEAVAQIVNADTNRVFGTDDTTGAVRLYERAGMHVARRWDQYEKPLDG